MYKVHSENIYSKGRHKIIEFISNFLNKENMPPFMKVHVHWMNLMKNQIIQKFQSFEILKEKVTKQKTRLKNHLTKNYVRWVQMSNFRCKSHVKEINMVKNMFGWPLKLILGFFGIRLKYSYTIMYDCEKSPSTHELSYIGLLSLKFVSCKCYL